MIEQRADKISQLRYCVACEHGCCMYPRTMPAAWYDLVTPLAAQIFEILFRDHDFIRGRSAHLGPGNHNVDKTGDQQSANNQPISAQYSAMLRATYCVLHNAYILGSLSDVTAGCLEVTLCKQPRGQFLSKYDENVQNCDGNIRLNIYRMIRKLWIKRSGVIRRTYSIKITQYIRIVNLVVSNHNYI